MSGGVCACAVHMCVLGGGGGAVVSVVGCARVWCACVCVGGIAFRHLPGRMS